MRIAVTGSTGLVGSALSAEARAEGHEIVPVLRGPARTPDDISWDPEAGRCDPADFEDIDAVVHLAGENIAGGRWTAARKRRIADSRIDGTALFAGALAACASPPRVLVSASAIGYYGSRGDAVLTESSGPGQGFLPGVCERWEAAADGARNAGIRVVHPRIGIVLSAEGGALAKMLPPFKLGLGGAMGSGRQWMSWITLDDVVGVFLRAVSDESLTGAVNCVAPEPVTNAQFTKSLGAALHRPTVLSLPAFAARTLLGEMADELLLSSTRVVPEALLGAGYAFRQRGLESALTHALGLEPVNASA